MTVTKQKTETMLNFTVSLSPEAHSLAQQLTKDIKDPKKNQQVYLNTLSVFAVNFYLNCLGFETSYRNCDSHDRTMVKLMNVADLEIKNLGKLECRYVLPDREVCQIPPEVWEDRLGYAIVELDRQLRSATILGFVRSAAAEVPLNKLKSLEDLIYYLSDLESKQSKLDPVTELGKWLQGVFEKEWLEVDRILSPELIGMAFRGQLDITKAKKIDLGLDFNGHLTALVVKIIREVDGEIDIVMQLHPLDRNYLPSNLQLIVYDRNNNPVLEATAREKDNFIQLEFTAEIGEIFKATVIFEGERIEQKFAV